MPATHRRQLRTAPLVAALVVWSGSAAAAPAPWLPDAAVVRALEFTGPQTVDRTVLHAELRWLVGERASEPNLRRAVEVLGSLPGLGGIDVLTAPQQGADGVLVTFRFDARVSTVERMEVTDEAEGPPHGPPRSELWRQVQASPFSFSLSEGRPFHPFLMELDRRNARRYFLGRGYLDAQATAELYFDGDLASVVLRVLTGRRMRIREVRILGLEGDAGAAPTQKKLGLRKGERPSPWLLENTTERLREQLCGRGYADAQVTAELVRGEDAWVDVVFRVVPGLRQRIARLVVGHASKQTGTDSARGLAVGAAYCPDQVEAAVEGIREELRQYGFLDAFVQAESTAHPPKQGGSEGTVDIRIHVRPGRPAVVARVWFEGAVVTRDNVLRSLVTIEEGDLLLQEEIDGSLQNLRASGLFRRASARVLRSGDGRRHYVSFRLEERDVLTIDPTKYELTLHNLHLYQLPGSLSEPEAVVSLRGGGQELWFKGVDTWLAVRLTDAFLMEQLVLSLQLERRAHSYEQLEEVAYAARLGLGWSALSKRLQLVPLLRAELSFPDAPSSYDVLPVARDDLASLSLGVDFRFDHNDRDGERVPYLGLGLHAQVIGTALAPADRDRDLLSYQASVEGNVPLYENAAGQHVVLHAEVGTMGVFARSPDRLPAHRRVTPSLRGFSANAVRVPYEVAGDEVLLGGTSAWETRLELRVPLPWRRNALSPFVNAAGAGAVGDAPWHGARAAAGLRYDLSLLDERIEGYIHGAYPFGDDTYAEYYAVGLGGSF